MRNIAKALDATLNDADTQNLFYDIDGNLWLNLWKKCGMHLDEHVWKSICDSLRYQPTAPLMGIHLFEKINRKENSS